MKKLILTLALMLGTLSFANTGETKTERYKTTYALIEKDASGKIVNTKQFDTEEELLRYCITSTIRWYQYSFEGMDGGTYDVYEVHESTTCYAV